MDNFTDILGKTTKLGLLAAAAGLISTTSVNANPQVCDKYARDAQSIFHKAQVLKCGFKPPVWSGNYKHHYDWCMVGTNASTASAHTANRAAKFAACQAQKGQQSKVDTCRIYALDAVTANKEAAKLGCGFKPPVWSNNHQNHFDWCIQGANVSSTPGHTAKRTAALAKCRAAKAAAPPPKTSTGKLAVCDLYANEALRLAAQASALGCGFSGPRWLQSYQTHYKFCLKDPSPIILLAEAAARDKAYKSCKASAATPPAKGGVPVWVFADSNTRRLSAADVSGLSRSRLWQARNEIVARKGYIFKTAKARNFFAQMPWYKPVSKSVTVNAVERANMALIKTYE